MFECAKAKALGCDWKELLRAVKRGAPPPDALEAEEADLSPEDERELPDPATLPPEPLLPGTMEVLSRTYRADEGKRFTFEGRIEMPRYLDLQERVAIKCIEIEDGVCFETTLYMDGVAIRVPVYSNRGSISDALFEAHGHKHRMRFVVKVLVVESTDEFGTIPDGSNIPMSVFVKWKGFTWPLPEPKQMWCFVATGVAPIEPDSSDQSE